MIIAWNSAHYTFAGETFFKTGESVIVTHRTFCAHFMFCQNDMVTAWTSAHYTFAVAIFFKTSESVITHTYTAIHGDDEKLSVQQRK